MKKGIANVEWADRIIEIELENESLRKQVNSLKAEKLKLDCLANNITIGVIIANSNYRITHCNKRFNDIFKIEESEKLIGEDVCRAFDLASAHFHNKDRYLIRLKSIIYQTDPIKNNKLELSDHRVLELNYTPVIAENKLQSIILTFRDITARYDQNHGNNISKVWQQAIEGSNDGVWDWNLKNNHVYYSPQWKKMLGFASNDIDGSLDEWKKRVHPDDLDHTLKEVQKHLNGETEYYQSEHRLKCKDNTFKWILDRGKVVAYNKEGEPTRMVGTHTDITKRRRAEEDLKELNRTLDQERKLFMSGNVVVFKIENKEGWPIMYVSPNVKSVLGYTESDIYNPSFSIIKLIHRSDIKKRLYTSQVSSNTSSINNFYNEPYRLIKKNGDIVWVQEYTHIIKNRKGEVKGYVGYLVDVSEMIKTRKELIRNQKTLKQLNDTKDKFLSILAHDLKGSFNTLMGFSDIILDNIENNELDNLQRFTQIIHNTSNRTYLLFTNLLNWIKKQTKNIKINPQQFSTDNIINETIEISKHLAKEKQVNVTAKPYKDVIMTADKNMVSTTLRNLVSNAIKYVDKGGHVTLHAEPKNNSIEFTVSDNGVGIAPENLNKLFRENSNVSTIGTNYEKGTGLGLIICKEFITLHGGKIWVTSKENSGTTFKFTIPKKLSIKIEKKSKTTDNQHGRK